MRMANRLALTCLVLIPAFSVLLKFLVSRVQYNAPRVSDYYFEFPIQNPRRQHPLPSPDPFPNRRLPKLVWWTDSFTPVSGRDVLRCALGSCRVGGFREAGSTDALMFYGTEFDPYDLPLPRNPDLIWALFHEESPLNSFHLCTPEVIKLFNFTATPSRHSNLPLTTSHISHTSQLSHFPPKETIHKNLLQREMGLSPVVYVQSHCSVPSYRDRLVTELMRYIRVDSYGQCLHNKDLPPILSQPLDSMFSSEFYKVLSDYKFILTFENAIGYDYISEKIVRAFEIGVVPVYYGSGTVSEWAPAPHSVIEVINFESMKQLGEYLHLLNSNETAYNEYLRFKQTDGVVNQLLLKNLEQQAFTSMYHYEFSSEFEDRTRTPKPSAMTVFQCEVCNVLYEQRKLREEGKAVSRKFANFSHFICPTPHLDFGLDYSDMQENIFSSDEEFDWYNYYWQSFIEANVISSLTHMNISQVSAEWYQELVVKAKKSYFPSILH